MPTPTNKLCFKTSFLLFTLIVIASSTFAYDITRVPPFVTDPNAPQPTQKPPAKPPWDWVGAKEPVSLGPGGHIWIGSYNTYDPNRTKRVRLRVNSDWNDQLEAESAVGYTPTGSTVTGTIDDPNGFTNTDSSGEYWVVNVRFKCQPEWEAIKIKNNGPNHNLFDNTRITYWCYDYSSVGNMCDLYNATIGHPENSREITKLLMTHTQAPVDPVVLPVLIDYNPANVWDVNYTTMDPITGLTLPQSGWLWTCIAGPGIASGERFDMSMKVLECMPEGKLALYVFDGLAEEEWVIYHAYDPEPEPMISDISQPRDCKVDLRDFSVLADNWLMGVF